jgi:hypothetical protein
MSGFSARRRGLEKIIHDKTCCFDGTLVFQNVEVSVVVCVCVCVHGWSVSGFRDPMREDVTGDLNIDETSRECLYADGSGGPGQESLDGEQLGEKGWCVE